MWIIAVVFLIPLRLAGPSLWFLQSESCFLGTTGIKVSLLPAEGHFQGESVLGFFARLNGTNLEAWN